MKTEKITALRRLFEVAPYHPEELVLSDSSIESKCDYIIVRTFGVFWDDRLKFLFALLRAAPSLLDAAEEASRLKDALRELVKHTPSHLLYEQDGSQRRAAKQKARELLGEP